MRLLLINELVKRRFGVAQFATACTTRYDRTFDCIANIVFPPNFSCSLGIDHAFRRCSIDDHSHRSICYHSVRPNHILDTCRSFCLQVMKIGFDGKASCRINNTTEKGVFIPQFAKLDSVRRIRGVAKNPPNIYSNSSDRRDCKGVHPHRLFTVCAIGTVRRKNEAKPPEFKVGSAVLMTSSNDVEFP